MAFLILTTIGLMDLANVTDDHDDDLLTAVIGFALETTLISYDGSLSSLLDFAYVQARERLTMRPKDFDYTIMVPTLKGWFAKVVPEHSDRENVLL